MKKIDHTFLLFLIILIEGYVVLSAELLAMRQTIAYVGSGTDTVSIIIAAVLMPLAFGYQYGGNFVQKRYLNHYITIRKKLIFNMVVAALILLPGMSYITILGFFYGLDTIGITNRIAQISLYCGTFIVIPVYLLGQTIPLVSNYFSKQSLSLITGKMLCFSTLGSFLGAVFSTLVLMSTIGVNNTAALLFVLLAFLVILLSKKKTSTSVATIICIAVVALTLNSNSVMSDLGIVKSNKYNDLQVVYNPDTTDRHLFINNNDSSKYNDRHEKHDYVEFSERVTIEPVDVTAPPKEILVIGAGAFTYGNEDKHNNYTFVDIDEDLLKVAEEYIIKEKLSERKEFFPLDIRAYLRSTDKKFDVVFLDAYLGGLSIPESLVTQEFFAQVKAAMNDKAILITNFIVSPNFSNKFSRSIDDTLRSVFPHVSRYVVNEKYDLWEDSPTNAANVAYIYRHDVDYEMGSIYTDNKNTVFLEKPKKLGK